MFRDSARSYDRDDLHGVPAVGDSRRDLQAAAMAGCSPWLVLTGNGQNTRDKGELPTGTHIADNLAAVVKARSEEHTSELQSLMRISYAVFCLKKKKHKQTEHAHI